MAEPGLDELRAELAEQRRLLDETHTMVLSIRRSLRIAYILTLIKWVILLVPLILAAIYLPPLIQQGMDAWQQYQQYMPSSNNAAAANIDFQQIQDFLQKSSLLNKK